MSLSPLLKWAGGKRQIIHELLSHFPAEFNDYHEPFVGAGSVFMEMAQRGLLDGKGVHLSDRMEPLMNLYRVVKDHPQRFLVEMENPRYANTLEAYTVLRARFNALKPLLHTEKEEVELAALFVYLNKTGFNGMYRENSKGGFNIPFGKQNNPTLCDPESLRRLSAFLNQDRVVLWCGDYSQHEARIKKGDFVYMDPPYHGTFTGYVKEGFGDKDQENLRDFFERLSTKGCRVALSNSNTPYIHQLYSGLAGVRILEIPVRRVINSKASARKDVLTELLIVNY
jgi:DNA adenine methylase